MTSDLRDLYQELILDHYRHPRNRRRVQDANRVAEGFNPLCGDRIHIYLRLEEGVVADAGFEGSGCAISTASASVMTEVLKGKTEAEAEALFQSFHDLVTGKAEPDPGRMGKTAAFAGVRDYPMRVKCATLAWHTLRAALRGSSETVATE